MLDPFLADKEANPKPIGPVQFRASTFPRGRDITLAADLFRHMTNFVAAHHGWRTGGNLIPSTYLQLEVSTDQVELINPSLRDVQVGAIIDQYTDKKTTKVVARHRIDFVSGNINSYARILNGPSQLDQITSYNQLAASISKLQQEREEHRRKNQEQKKKGDAEAAANRERREREAREKHDENLPICQALVDKGLDHIMTKTLKVKINILKYVFGHKEAKVHLKAARANAILIELMSVPHELDDALIVAELEPQVTLPELENIGLGEVNEEGTAI